MGKGMRGMRMGGMGVGVRMRVRVEKGRAEPIGRWDADATTCMHAAAWDVHLLVHGVMTAQRSHGRRWTVDGGRRGWRHGHTDPDVCSGAGRGQGHAGRSQGSHGADWAENANWTSGTDGHGRRRRTLSAIGLEAASETPLERRGPPSIG